MPALLIMACAVSCTRSRMESSSSVKMRRFFISHSPLHMEDSTLLECMAYTSADTGSCTGSTPELRRLIIIRSAFFPTSSEPISSSHSRHRAALTVAISSTCTAGSLVGNKVNQCSKQHFIYHIHPVITRYSVCSNGDSCAPFQHFRNPGKPEYTHGGGRIMRDFHIMQPEIIDFLVCHPDCMHSQHIRTQYPEMIQVFYSCPSVLFFHKVGLLRNLGYMHMEMMLSIRLEPNELSLSFNAL